MNEKFSLKKDASVQLGLLKNTSTTPFFYIVLDCFISYFFLQDKALRRISELKEQNDLERKGKRHLEEELRSDLEEKDHIIKALQTKVVLLKSGGNNVIEDEKDTNGGENAQSTG